MKQKQSLSTASKLTIVSLITAATGVVIQIASGAAYPAIPPVFFILLLPAILIGLGRWRWTPITAVAGSGFLVFGFFSSGSVAKLFNLNQSGAATGLWLQMLAVIVAVIAGIIATARNYQK